MTTHSSKDVDSQYVKMTQREHILKRPDTYGGSIESTREEGWIWNDVLKKTEKREYSYVPGLFKIFDEILVNAADNRQRDATMDVLRVNIN